MIQFPKEPNCYDLYGAPYYYSKCNKYRLRHIRTGFVNKKGKCAIEQWFIYYNHGRKLDWSDSIPINRICQTRKEAIKLANNHDLFLRAEKHVKKKQKGNGKSSRSLRR